ncbi:MAG: sigma-54-dependent transcriptional regulator [Gammaproteobacteria bacterium WSBS_2016_MAG_OTU1]
MPAKPSLLMVDDDPLIQELIGGWFCDEFNIIGAHNLTEVKSALQQMPESPDYALVDLGLPPMPNRPDEGFEVIRLLQSVAAECAIVVVSGQESRRHAQRARALGAGDYVEKPCAPDVLRQKLLSCRQVLKNTRRNMGLVGESSPMKRLRTDINQIAAAPFPVLIIGETGSGKELVSHALHEQGRATRPFIPINCAAIPEHLAESSLFGHAKGAFTGATTANAGMLGEAEDGTLFLDEIGDLSPLIQGKLLRVIETGEYNRVGEMRPRQCGARIVAATNRVLEGEGDGFRRDLYHRISAFTLRTPPLRDLADDRLLLLEHFRERIAADMQTPPFAISAAAQKRWLSYQFPGNIRELRNIVVRLQVKYGGQCAEENDILAEFCPDETAGSFADGTGSLDARVKHFAALLLGGGDASLPAVVSELEKAMTRQALANCSGDEAQAAAMLSVTEGEFQRLKNLLEKLS